jgi:hypothetical protein
MGIRRRRRMNGIGGRMCAARKCAKKRAATGTVEHGRPGGACPPRDEMARRRLGDARSAECYLASGENRTYLPRRDQSACRVWRQE